LADFFAADAICSVRRLDELLDTATKGRINMLTKTIAGACLLALLVAAPAFTQTNLKANIPFDFKMGATQMTAGEYTVVFLAPSIVQLVRDDRKASCAVNAMAVQANTTPDAGRLVFNKYGESIFLSQIWRPGYDQGRELHKSKVELEVARNNAGVQRASVPIVPGERASRK
jgi:hypothetical protein